MITHGVVQYPRDSGGKLPYILHYGIDFNIGDSYNWNPMVYSPYPNPNPNPNPSPSPSPSPGPNPTPKAGKGVPWFAFGFIGVATVNSVRSIPITRACTPVTTLL